MAVWSQHSELNSWCRGVTDTANTSKDKKGSASPKTDEKDPSVDEEMVTVVTQEQDKKARDVENYADQFPGMYSSKWPDLGKTNDRMANIADLLFSSLTSTTKLMIKHGEPFDPAFYWWQKCTADFEDREKDGRIQRAMEIIAQNPVSTPTPNLEQWINGLKEKMFALNGEMAKGGEKIMRPKIGGKPHPGKGFK